MITLVASSEEIVHNGLRFTVELEEQGSFSVFIFNHELSLQSVSLSFETRISEIQVRPNQGCRILGIPVLATAIVEVKSVF